MGLSGPKRRTKLSSDPNNTNWSKSTDSFGHKILLAQGWKPGQLLGAENAAHAEHYTAANASHIRVILREDNLGLGAELGKGNAETFGLSTLSGIFGRLNGKSDADLEKMQVAQRDAELRTYHTRKFGHMTFVRGGLLVGDKMEEDTQPTPSQEAKGENHSQEVAVIRKKRKHDGDIEDGEIRKKKKNKVVALNETKAQPAEEQPDVESDTTSDNTDTPITTIPDDKKAAKAARKAERAEKRARKEERRKRKEERAARREERRKSRPVVEAPDVKPTTATGSRSAFRQRFMQQKRLASMDVRALNEILMLKTAVA